MRDENMADRERSGAITAVVLAAGESTRMGQPKALLPWGPEHDPAAPPLVVYQLQALSEAGVAHVIVVLGHEAARLRAALAQHGWDGRATIVENTAYRDGRSTSVIAGVSAAPIDQHVLLINVDQPRPAWVLRRLAEAHVTGGAAITIPSYGRRRGHPPVFAPHLRAELLGVAEATQGLRAVVRRHWAEVHLVSFADAVVLTNLNTPAAYRAARSARFATDRPPA